MRLSLLLALACLAAGQARPSDAPAARMSPEQVGRALDTTLARERYSWREPQREVPSSQESTVAGELLRQLARSVADLLGTLWRWFSGIGRWIGGLFHHDHDEGAAISAPPDLRDTIMVAAWLLLAAASCALAVSAWRAWKKSGADGRAELLELQAAKPDLNSEELSGGELPMDEWRRMGSEAMARGDYRLALRAWYLAALSELAARQWLALKKSRTGREYQRELRRKAPQREELHGLFQGLSADFERAWYGAWDLQRQDAERYALLFERLDGLAS